MEVVIICLTLRETSNCAINIESGVDCCPVFIIGTPKSTVPQSFWPLQMGCSVAQKHHPQW